MSSGTQCFQFFWDLSILGVSILGDIQNPYPNDPGQSALGGPAWAEYLNKMNSGSPFQPHPIYDFDSDNKLAYFISTLNKILTPVKICCVEILLH